jgi:hypothetical protein
MYYDSDQDDSINWNCEVVEGWCQTWTISWWFLLKGGTISYNNCLVVSVRHVTVFCEPLLTMIFTISIYFCWSMLFHMIYLDVISATIGVSNLSLVQLSTQWDPSLMWTLPMNTWIKYLNRDLWSISYWVFTISIASIDSPFTFQGKKIVTVQDVLKIFDNQLANNVFYATFQTGRGL